MYSYHGGHLTHWLSLEDVAEEILVQTTASAKVNINPLPVDAALFAFASPISNRVSREKNSLGGPAHRQGRLANLNKLMERATLPC